MDNKTPKISERVKMKDPNCIFCKIVAGEIPSHKVYEDEHFMAFLDIHPQSAGHTQVIPKEHHRWVWDLPLGQTPGNIGAYFEIAQKIAKAQQKAFNTELIRSQVFGDEVPHAHIWVFPHSAEGDKMDFAGNAEKIRRNL